MNRTLGNTYKYSCLLMLILIAATVVVGLVLSSSRSQAASTSATASVTVGSACTMSATVNTAHSAEVPAGTSRQNIGSTTLNTICNDSGGFAIYAVGYSGSEYGNNTMINQSDNTITFNTGTNTSGNSSWAMKLEQDTTGTYATTLDNGFGSYSSVPATYTKVAHRDSATDAVSTNPAVGSSIRLTYQSYISTTQNAGTYEGKVKFTMVHPATEMPLQPQIATSGCINYFPNGSGVVGSMGCQSISASATSATLLAGNFSREGYGFAGWSNKYDYTTNPNQEDIKFYGPQENITFTAGQYTGTNNGLSLYAVWVKSQGNLQDTSKVASVCSGLTTAPTDGTANLASVSALTDQRDNQTYAIAKLADGQCWMIENLRLESRDTVGDNRFDSSKTNQSLAQGYGTSATYGNFSGLATAESTGFTDTYSANSLYSNDGSNDTINIGTSNYPACRMPRYNNLNTPADANNRPQNPTSNTFTNNNTTVGMYSYGNYYTWHAAIADTTYYNSGDHGTTSLCPTGWRLPIGNQSTATNSFGALSVALGGPEGGATANSSSTPTGTVMTKTFRSYPNNFLFSGYFATSSTGTRGSSGYYWSSTAYSYNYSYGLRLSSSYVYPGTSLLDKDYGGSVRCTTSAGS